MPYIELGDITEQHLLGQWEVESRFVNAPDIVSPFAKHYYLEFQSGGICIFKNGGETYAAWELGREKEVIYNPKIKFSREGAEIGTAIITRLMVNDEKKFSAMKLTLYFSSGTELVLKKMSGVLKNSL